VNRQVAVYSALGAALAVLSLGTVGWAVSVTDSGAAAAPSAVAEQAAEVLPVATPIPADDAIRGSATDIAANLKLESDPSVPQANQIKICDTEVKGWARSESIRLNDSGVGLTVQVAAWRAGAAASAFDDLEKNADSCAQVSKSESADEFRAGISSGDGQWASGVRRIGDVLIATSASSAGSDPAQWVDRVLAEGQKVMKTRLAGVCIDPTSARANDHVERDPYSGKYSGFKVASPRKLEDQPILSKVQIASIKDKQPKSTWSGPPLVADPTLAPIKVEPGSPPAPEGADPSTAVRTTAPMLADVKKFVPPKDPEPSSENDALKEPATPDIGDGVSVAMIPAVDNSGPGCGWDFAGTINPVTTEAELAAGARQAVIAALVKDTQAQGQRMVAAINWPAQHQAWVAKASIAKSWDDYRAELQLAKDRLSKAKQKYQDSVDEWRQGTLLPEPTASPDPSGSSATPTPDQQQGAQGGTQ
jgi:hypothetical protein